MGKRIVILGAGESGVGAALLAQKQGYDVFVSDFGKVKEKYQAELSHAAIAWEQEQHTEAEILNADEVIKSPGIPEKSPIIKKLREAGIAIISEIEFAARYTDATIIAITGSNGKSTCTSLAYHIFEKAGTNVAIAGNIGDSFARKVAEKPYDYYVLEISSFQLDDIKEFHPKVSVLLNITPDHLDRYNYEFENYIDAKFKITKNQTAEDYFIYCSDDEVINRRMESRPVSAQALPFSLKKKPNSVGYTENDQIIIQHKTKFTMSINDLSLRGSHNVYNTLAAGIAARIFDLKKDIIRDSMVDFKSLDHRLEFVAKVSGVEFINDSKATNVNSTWYALETMSKPIIWIAGGVDKGNDYEVLKELVKGKVKAIVCLGTDNLRIHEAFSKHVDVLVNTQSAKEAVQIAYRLSDKGDAVLLSPACASFDLFENYEDRGNQFKTAVRSL